MIIPEIGPMITPGSEKATPYIDICAGVASNLYAAYAQMAIMVANEPMALIASARRNAPLRTDHGVADSSVTEANVQRRCVLD